MSESVSIPTALINRAIAGQAEAQFEVAVLYMQSDFDEDIELAEEWALKAASNGHIEAMYWLGEGYTVYAKDVQEDDPEDAKYHFDQAFFWLKQASDAQHPAAILELSGFYRRGDVVDKDVARSVALVQQAAELGEVQAMRDLAFIYENALGVDADETKADYWTQKADAAQ
ncbi:MULTISPECIES: tetratricopeptide repeat protein [Acinetobacter]|uniref:tetratricopeptide repeat protein n=1 Tax=Acinetobacter TaxID=469 RepID=UPI0014474E87|nr:MULTISPECIES: tetratricopeptide repeat protein [Acinetobacter]MDM1485963.1 sel1 repeat family protein [Acinetobacter towneri]